MNEKRRPGSIPFALVPVLGLGGWLDVGLFWWVVVFVAGVGAGVLGKIAVERRLAAWRARRFDQAMEEGDAAANERDWDAAISAFQRATQLDPEDPLAWFYRGLALVKGGRYEACLAILDDVCRARGMDPWDLKYLEVAAAWGAGRNAHAARVLESMARESPKMARGIIEREGIDLDEMGPEVKHILDAQDPEADWRDAYV